MVFPLYARLDESLPLTQRRDYHRPIHPWNW